MAIHITQIGKHKFICGLFWQSLSRPRELLKEAASLGRKIDSDLMVLLREHTTAQAGFAQTRDGARRMHYSLAAAVSKTLLTEGVHYNGQKQPVHDWLGAFKLPDGLWAYFAVRDANFLPNGDFAGTKEEVMERLHGDYGLGGWNAVIGDAELEDYGFHNFSAKRIEELIPHKKNGQIRTHRWWGLRPIDPSRKRGQIAVLAFVALALAVGGGYYWNQYQKRKAEEERARAIEAARLRLLKDASRPADRPWPGKPTPSVAARACLQNFSHRNVGGWRLEQYQCSVNQASYTWARQGSTIAFLLEQVPDAVVDMSGNKATYSLPLKIETGKNEDLIQRKDLLNGLMGRLQLLRLAAKIEQMRESPPPASSRRGNSRDAQQKAAPPPWKVFSYSLDTGSLPPAEVAALLSQPGVRLDRMSFNGEVWSLEGVMYAK